MMMGVHLFLILNAPRERTSRGLSFGNAFSEQTHFPNKKVTAIQNYQIKNRKDKLGAMAQLTKIQTRIMPRMTFYVKVQTNRTSRRTHDYNRGLYSAGAQL